MVPNLPFALIPGDLTTKLLTIAAPLGVLAILPYFLFRLPEPESKLKIHPGLGELTGPDTARLKELYPEDIYEGGAYADLPLGKLKYYIVGSEFSRKLVIIGGTMMPSPVSYPLVKELSKDFLVLVYDHYGRGYSQAPEAKYDGAFYANELAQLMQHIGWTKAHVVGISLGGGIAAQFAATYPYLVDEKVTFVAPAGLMRSEHIPLRGKVLSAPVFQWLLSFHAVRKVLIPKDGGAEARAMGVNPTTQNAKQKEFREIVALSQIVLPYNIGCLASTIRYGPLRGQEENYETIGKSDLKVLVIWGTADKAVPYALAGELLKLVPQAKLVTLEGHGHEIETTQAEPIAAEVKAFFS